MKKGKVILIIVLLTMVACKDQNSQVPTSTTLSVLVETQVPDRTRSVIPDQATDSIPSRVSPTDIASYPGQQLTPSPVPSVTISTIATFTPAIEASPTTIISSELFNIMIAFVRDDQIWLWTQGRERLIKSPINVPSFPKIRISHNGEWIAFVNDEGLWLLSTDHEEERLIFSSSNFVGYSSPASQLIFDLQWVPDSSVVSFQAYLAEGDDPTLVLIDVHSGETSVCRRQW